MLHLIFLYFIFNFVSLALIKKKKRKSIFYLPIILIILEISRIVFEAFHLSTLGFNGLLFNILLCFVIFNTRLVKKERYNYLISILFILLIYFFFRLSPDIELSNKISRLGTFILILMLVPVSYLNGIYIEKKEILSILHKLFFIFFVYTIFASVLKFGPNHYNTNIIYGFKYEHWCLGAFLLTIYYTTIFLEKEKHKQSLLNYIILLVCLFVLLLVLRRMVWFLVFFVPAVTMFMMHKKTIGSKKILSTLLAFFFIIVFVVFVINKLGVWSQRGARNLRISYVTSDAYQKEGRYIEFGFVLSKLQSTKDKLFGTGFLFDEAGRYNFPEPTRPLHGTYTKLFFGAGLFGIFIYLYFLIVCLLNLYKIFKFSKNYFNATIFSSFLAYLFVLFTGASGHNVSAPYVATLFIASGFTMTANRESAGGLRSKKS